MITECVVTRTGLYEVRPNSATGVLDGIDQVAIQHHPQTFPYADDAGQGAAQVITGAATRAGQTIQLKGLAVKGFLVLGKNCPNARVHIGIYKAESTLNQPFSYLASLDGMELRRQIPHFEKLNKTKCGKTWTLNHRSAEDSLKVPVNLYLKIGKRVRYNEKQPAMVVQSPMDQQWYTDDRYYLVAYSDVPNADPQTGIPNNVPNLQLITELEKWPRFYGSFRAYYRDG